VSYVLLDVEDLVQDLRKKSLATKSYYRDGIQRLQVMAQIVRVITHTMVTDKRDLRQMVADDLREIEYLSSRLGKDDVYFRDLAKILPAPVDYVCGSYRTALDRLDQSWPSLVDSSVRAMCLRDQLVIAGLLSNEEVYKRLAKLSEMVISDRQLTLAGSAKVLQGKALGAHYLSLPNGQADLTQAEELITEARIRGDRRCFTEAQIARAKVDLALHFKQPDRDSILILAKTAANLLVSGGYKRCLTDLKGKLTMTQWPEVQALGASL
jgi:hypothetical protein